MDRALKDALVLARTYLQQGLIAGGSLKAQAVGPCPKIGPKLDVSAFPNVANKRALDKERPEGAFAPWLKHPTTTDMSKVLYPVVSTLDHLELCLKHQVPIVQMRVKQGTQSEKLRIIRTAIKMAHNSSTSLYVNDEWQLAIDESAFGVHLGQEDLETASLDQIKSAKLALGISTHGYYELLSSLSHRPSYIAVGSIFPTTTKDMSGQIQGLDHLKALSHISQHYGVPCVAIGGIQLSNEPLLRNCPIQAIAVVSAITQANHPEEAIVAWKKRLTSHTNQSELTE